jgi:ParB family transcriptional regulator, chromosome partitioning protein
MAAASSSKASSKKTPPGSHDIPLKPSDATYASIPPEKIRANPKNPRMFFHDDTIEQLADSLAQKGVLVPLTVYAHNGPGKTTHVLLDGERRWRAAKLINLPQVPAWVIPKPTGVENTLRMFNIHMLREEWDELAIAWALEQLMEDLGTDTVEDLRKETGLSRDRIRNIKILLAFPKSDQERVARGELSFNYLVELQKNVLTKLRRAPETIPGHTERHIRTAFIRKYLDNIDTDPIALRQVGKLIDTARIDGGVGARAREALQALLEEPEMTVEEAYEIGAAASVELRRVLRDMGELPDRIDVLLQGDLDSSESRQLVTALRRLQHSLKQLLVRAEA